MYLLSKFANPEEFKNSSSNLVLCDKKCSFCYGFKEIRIARLDLKEAQITQQNVKNTLLSNVEKVR